MLKITHKLWSIGIILSTLIFSSCEDNEKEPVVKPPQKITLYFSNDGGQTFPAQYEGVRIGEYYWMNSNFNHIEGRQVEREDIDKILKIYRMNPALFTVSMDNFSKYFGEYYPRNQVDNKMNDGEMYEGVGKTKNKGWDLPTVSAFRQLFGMCGDGGIGAVVRYLSCKPNDNPAAIPVYGSNWISLENNNRYGFNMLPTGAIYNGPNEWVPHWDGGQGQSILSNDGDMYGFMQAVSYPAHGDITIRIHDYVDTQAEKLWHYMPIRWCRKLTNEELGYKLYINKNQTDIKKLELTENAPSGYTELANGYLRGFYVQFILDQTSPTKTVPQIVQMAKGLR